MLPVEVERMARRIEDALNDAGFEGGIEEVRPNGVVYQFFLRKPLTTEANSIIEIERCVAAVDGCDKVGVRQIGDYLCIEVTEGAPT